MNDWQLRTHKGIRSLSPYQPGKSPEDLFRERGISDAIKLASNENPWGCSPKVLTALSQITPHHLASYPGAYQHPLKYKIAQRYKLSDKQVVLSNGSDALFTLIFTLFCLHQQKSVLTHDHCFPSYPIQAQGFGIPVESISLDEHWQWSVDEFVRACDEKTGVLIFANPNNPTGQIVSLQSIRALLKRVPPSVIVVVDEAYSEFAFSDDNDSALSLLSQFENLIITRTLSKVYGIASLRLGYALANEQVAELIWRIQQPFSVNGLALHCGEVAWDDVSFVEETIQQTKVGLEFIKNQLSQLGYDYIPSYTNFITMNAGNQAGAINEHLLNHGIIVRPLGGSGMDNYLRVSVGTEFQNQRFIDTLAQV